MLKRFYQATISGLMLAAAMVLVAPQQAEAQKPTVEFAWGHGGTLTVVETDTKPETLGITVSGTLVQDTTVSIIVTDCDSGIRAIEGEDFTLSSKQITLPAGVNPSAELKVLGTADRKREHGSECRRVGLSAIPNAPYSIVAARSEVEFSLIDQSHEKLVWFSGGPTFRNKDGATYEEGDAAFTIPINLSEQFTTRKKIYIRAGTRSTAIPGRSADHENADYCVGDCIVGPGWLKSLIFNPGQIALDHTENRLGYTGSDPSTSEYLSVTIHDDDISEGREIIELTVHTSIVGPAIDRILIPIEDDDDVGDRTVGDKVGPSGLLKITSVHEVSEHQFEAPDSKWNCGIPRGSLTQQGKVQIARDITRPTEDPRFYELVRTFNTELTGVAVSYTHLTLPTILRV